MQRLYFEKQIDLNHGLKELVSIYVDEKLSYLDDERGKRAKGVLEISGEYLRTASKERFNDTIEIDVLAPFERLEENTTFCLEVQDFDYHIQNGDLHLEIQVLAHGVGEEQERHIVVDTEMEDEQALLEEIQSIVSKQALVESIETELEAKVPKTDDLEQKPEAINREPLENKRVEDEMLEELPKQELGIVQAEPMEVHDENIDVEDLFDDDLMAFVTYPIYVVKEKDSYETIAERYHVETKALMDYNQHIALTAHQLLIIPPK